MYWDFVGGSSRVLVGARAAPLLPQELAIFLRSLVSHIAAMMGTSYVIHNLDSELAMV